jgi:hypothetical protein
VEARKILNATEGGTHTHIYRQLYKAKEVDMNRNRKNENFQKYCFIYTYNIYIYIYITMGTAFFPEVKRPGCGVDHPPHLASRLKKEQSYISTPPLGLRGLF